MNIYFLQFLSKVNRIVKSYPDLTGYSSFITAGPFDATNFKYNDGISTSEVYNFTTDKMPDYSILVDDDGNVVSRWYVTETKWKRQGQWLVSLQRDVLADFRDEVTNATVLIEKATVSDNDPAIYNQEPLTFNQIKKEEKLLKDETGSAWLVGYLSSDNSANKKYDASSSLQVRKTVNGIANWEYYRYITEDMLGPAFDISFQVLLDGVNASGKWIAQYAFNEQGAAQTDTSGYISYGFTKIREGDYAYDVVAEYRAKSRNGWTDYTYSMEEVYWALMDKLSGYQELTSKFQDQAGIFSNSDDVGDMKAVDGAVIYDSVSHKTYVAHVKTTRDNVQRYAVNSATNLGVYLINLFKDTGIVSYKGSQFNSAKSCYVKYKVNTYRVELEEIQDGTVSATIPAGRRILNDAPYTMFAMPYSSVPFIVGGTEYQSDPIATISMARQISLELMSSGALYDLQILPYCPRRDMIGASGKITTVGQTASTDYTLIEDSNTTPVSIMLFGKESSFEFNVNESIEITDKKVQNQCDLWRLCSPNYNGVFEFNAAKNNGVDYFNIDCTYRPYNPYIHVNPNFKELYGSDYDDARGLICSGDFSMPASTDKWLEYEAQNKNYQNSFDRSIQHLEVEQKYERINQVTGAVAGVGVGAAEGAMIGGVYGAIAGAAISTAGGIADILLSENMRAENKQYAKDQFAFSLENIKALPNSLAKISAFNKNNKIFPFLEYYTCTDIEKEAFRNFLEYDGMTVNRIGRIADYLQDGKLQFVRARLIRALDLHDDKHIVDVIAMEMEKGAYYDTRSD